MKSTAVRSSLGLVIVNHIRNLVLFSTFCAFVKDLSGTLHVKVETTIGHAGQLGYYL
jgi:hypothetical protein